MLAPPSLLGNRRTPFITKVLQNLNHTCFEFPRTPYTGSPVSENTPSRNCLINSWRASRPWCTAGARGQNGACLPPYTRSRDPKIGPTSIYQTVSLGDSVNRGNEALNTSRKLHRPTFC